MTPDRPSRRELTPVGDLIDGVLAGIARSDVGPVVRLRRDWAEAAGRWSSRCRPVALHNESLTVEVATGMDASLLRFDTDGLLRGVQRVLGGTPPVTRLNIKVAAVADTAISRATDRFPV